MVIDIVFLFGVFWLATHSFCFPLTLVNRALVGEIVNGAVVDECDLCLTGPVFEGSIQSTIQRFHVGSLERTIPLLKEFLLLFGHHTSSLFFLLSKRVCLLLKDTSDVVNTLAQTRDNG